MRTSFESWELAARLAMSDRGIDHGAAGPLIAAAKSHWVESGQDPWEALGTPDAFAVAAAQERPAAERAAHDTQGMTPIEHVSGALLVLAVLTIPAVLLAALTRGALTFPVTVAGLTGSLLFALCWVVVLGVPDAARAAGRPQGVRWAYGAGSVLAVASGVAFTQLPQTRFGALPVAVVVLVAAVLVWWLSRTRASRRRPAGGGDSGSRQWSGELRGLLIGRHDLPAGRADELVAEAEQHLAASGGTASEEFGPAGEYAAELAVGETTRQVPWWRGPAAALVSTVAGTVAAIQVAVGHWRDDHPVAAVLASAVALLGAVAVTRLIRKR
ncbi:hypothetical protein [Actinoplanes sp. NPDC020271]|uniref:hypothetical protein n=1 Tax=Actinoplanes sp. NPDC020271 TaxID=3363896 RepID=UPI0037B08819